ncbi:hypothetical protein B2G71_00425 [Novosphingobium sp. PC22D]|uniref:DUF2460 domain-containing protein n=1 Tax=Novosphingobium sp. PC22D TaxID=1962403 RepID=UPI000BF074AA|nr:DUF2460 domain-containing protein [Novosphingobium sp. PC22D]PEQ14124.1 hypothetical protein B2G71_00425 [Novosphingobium sp. PC22D]
MAFWLAAKREGQVFDHVRRFDPRFWTVNFPRPMVASVVTQGPAAMRIEAMFLRKADLAGLIWDSTDRYDHPLLAYETRKDYTQTTLSFRWQSSGIIPLDGINGPTLTIEGRDPQGVPRTWYVRLWNYAEGTPEDARIVLPFSQLQGGFTLPEQADPVWPGDVDRMFISLVAPGYEPGVDEPLEVAVEGWIELAEIDCQGRNALLEIGDVMIPPHGLAVATGFDDNGVVTPARLVRNIRQLGYRGSVVHYVGMSHYFRLEHRDEAYLAAKTGDVLNAATRQWHEAFFAECGDNGLRPIASLSYELLAQNCPPEWMQRDWLGQPAMTGWDPPSSLLSPANAEAMAWLREAARAFVGAMLAAGVPVRFQVGEPWWWIFVDGRICLYDSEARTAFGGDPPEIADMRAPLEEDQLALLDAAGTLLAQTTAALVAAARDEAGSASFESLLLVFPPTLLDAEMPEARRADLPVAWAHPAFDRLQVEDYDWLTAGADADRARGYTVINDRLGYPPSEQDYFAGFVLLASQGDKWLRIDAGIDEARARNPHEIVVWAVPQVIRDGYVRLPENEDEQDMQAFDDVRYPLALGRDATVIPEFSTSVMVTASGFERRSSLWTNARLRFDVGPGIRSEAELGELIAFFRARRGPARGFRLRDPSDFSSNGMVGTPSALDQFLGTGDGTRSRFALIKHYGSGEAVQVRRITRPIFETLLVSIDGALAVGSWALDEGGVIAFDAPPPEGAEVRAGFLFDVPVRFAEDQLEISGAAFAAGEAPSVPVVEVREAA